MKKFQLAVLLVLCVALLGLTLPTPSHAATAVTITGWTHDQLYVNYFKTRTAEFEKMHPDIQFTWNWVVKPNAWDDALKAIAAGEAVPDLLGIERGAFGNFIKGGIIEKYFVDLSDLIKDPTQYSTARMAIYSYNGKLYGLESSLSASVFYYQPKIYKDNGVDVPKTWEDMVAAGDKLGAKNIAQDFATDDGSWFHMLLHQRGGLVFDKDSKFVLGDSTNRPLAVEVATLIQNGVKNGTFMKVLGNDVWSGATIPTAYRTGKLAGTVMPDWWSSCCLQPGVKDMAGQWALAVPPTWKGGGHKTLTWGGTGWAVSSQSPNAALAKEFLGFAYLGVDSQVQKFQAINMFPWMLTAYKDPRILETADPFYGGAKIGELFAQMADDVPTWYPSPYLANFNKAAGDNLPALFDGKMTPDQFVDAVVKTTQDAIDFGS